MVANSRVAASEGAVRILHEGQAFCQACPNVSLAASTGRFGGKPPLTLQAHPRQDGDSPREACRTDADRPSLGASVLIK
jgi:hypothetical protein